MGDLIRPLQTGQPCHACGEETSAAYLSVQEDQAGGLPVGAALCSGCSYEFRYHSWLRSGPAGEGEDELYRESRLRDLEASRRMARDLAATRRSRGLPEDPDYVGE